MLKRRRNARCTAVADSFLINSRTQNILCCIVVILLSNDAAARLCARRALQWWYLKIQDLLFQMLCRSFTYRVQFREYRRRKLRPSFLITLYYPLDTAERMLLHSSVYHENKSSQYSVFKYIPQQQFIHVHVRNSLYLISRDVNFPTIT